MAKYSEKNVVKIKKDILIASEELALINQAREEALVALSSLGKEVLAERNKLTVVKESFAVELNKSKAEKALLSKEVSELKRNKSLLNSQIDIFSAMLRNTIERVSTQSSKVLIDDLVNTSVSILKNLTNKRQIEQETIRGLEEEHSRLTEMVSLIKTTETAYQESLNSVRSELISVTKQLEQANKTIRDISNREHDVRVMENRLKPAYQEFINKRTNELRDKKVRG